MGFYCSTFLDESMSYFHEMETYGDIFFTRKQLFEGAELLWARLNLTCFASSAVYGIQFPIKGVQTIPTTLGLMRTIQKKNG